MLEAQPGPSGWPSPQAIVIAIALHAAAIAWLMAPHAPPPPEDSIAVTLLVEGPTGDPVPAAPREPESAPSGARQDSPDESAHNGEAASPPPGDREVEHRPAKARRAPEATQANRPKRPTASGSAPAPSRPARPPEAQGDASSEVYTQEGSLEAPEGTAVYRVLIGLDGSVQGISLARSSGTPSFDEAGIGMIRDTMSRDPPHTDSAGSEMIVTLHFSPEGR